MNNQEAIEILDNYNQFITGNSECFIFSMKQVSAALSFIIEKSKKQKQFEKSHLLLENLN